MRNSYNTAAAISHLTSIFIEVHFPFFSPFPPALSIMNYHDRLVNLVCIDCVHSINKLIQLAVSNGMYINNSQLCSLSAVRILLWSMLPPLVLIQR